MDRIEACAQAAHEANRVYAIAIGETPLPHWEDTPEWMKNSARNGVPAALAGATAEELHECWMREKLDNGWSYGPVKDAAAKTHPCLLPYDELPETQRAKDWIFSHVVRALSDSLRTAVLSAYWGKAQRDVMFDGLRTDTRLLYHILCCVPFDGSASVLDELEKRGYDLATLKLSIRKKLVDGKDQSENTTKEPK